MLSLNHDDDNFNSFFCVCGGGGCVGGGACVCVIQNGCLGPRLQHAHSVRGCFIIFDVLGVIDTGY